MTIVEDLQEKANSYGIYVCVLCFNEFTNPDEAKKCYWSHEEVAE